MGRCIDYCEKRSFEICSLTVEPSNRTAIKLYERFGFINVETSQNYYGNGTARLIMTRTWM